ncbi:MAG TPA: tyrosine-type recombinase/integrase [Caulobacteraceae bacterium]|jgi:integrase
MPAPKPRGVSSYFDRHGKRWWRFRAKGLKGSQTKALFGSAEWWTWYHAAEAGTAPPEQGAGAERTRPGTIGALVAAYYTSADWKQLGVSTRKGRRLKLDRFRAQHADKPAAGLEPRHIRGLMDEHAHAPSTANDLLKALRGLMRFAVERNLRKDDPTLGVRKLAVRGDGYHSWSETEIEAFRARWPLGTKERLAFDLLLCTVQRSGDVRLMGPQHLREGALSIRQQKTGARLVIPLHADLAASIAAFPTDHLTYITTGAGQPYTAAGFGNWLRGAVRAAGLPVGVPPHGLRKAGARRLAEAGASAHQIQAITGHATLKEVERYTKAAEQAHLAASAMALLKGADSERTLSNQIARLDKMGGK